MMKKLSRAARVPVILVLTLFFIMACSMAAFGSQKVIEGNQQVKVKKLVMSPSKLQLYSGQTGNFTVQAVYTNKTVEDVTSQAVWATSKPDIATVTGGEVTAKAKGTAKITASFGGKKASKTVTVKLDKIKSLTADPSSVSISEDETEQITLTADYQGKGEVDVTDKAYWISKDSSIASVSNGTITGKAPGSVKIIASYEGKSVIINVEVKEQTVQVPAKITVEPTSLTMDANGAATKLVATVKDKDDKIMTEGYVLDWSTDNAAVASVDNGVVTPESGGTATITVTVHGTNLSANCAVTVNQTLPEIFDGTPTVGKFALGNTYALTITGKLKEPVTSVQVIVAGATYNAVISGTSFTCDATAPVTTTSLEVKVFKSNNQSDSCTLSF